MEFFPQLENNNCQIVAIKSTLSNFDIYKDDKEIKKGLPRHSFGNLITEMGVYFINNGFKTKLYLNNFYPYFNKVFYKSFEEYIKLGEFFDRPPEEKDISINPFIINVDHSKISKNGDSPAPHYVAVRKIEDVIYMFDGSNFNSEVVVTFSDLLDFSNSINKNKDQGVWLEVYR